MKKRKIRKRTRIKESKIKKKSKSIHSKYQSNKPYPTFEKDKLINYLRNEYAKIANNYLIKLYENIPDLENARRSLSIDLDIPTLDTPSDAERFNLYNLFQDLQKMHEKIPQALDRIYKHEPEIRELFPDLLKNQKLAKKLYKDLKEDNLLETTLEYQKNDKIRTHLWSTTIINMTNHLTFQPQKLVEYLDGNKLVISWHSNFKMFICKKCGLRFIAGQLNSGEKMPIYHVGERSGICKNCINNSEIMEFPEYLKCNNCHKDKHSKEFISQGQLTQIAKKMYICNECKKKLSSY